MRLQAFRQQDAADVLLPFQAVKFPVFIPVRSLTYPNEQKGPQRTRHLHQVHHTSQRQGAELSPVGSPREPILRTSYHWRKRRDVEIPWFEIDGSIKVKSLEAISAPNLRSVGGYIYSCTDSKVCFPNLQRVGGDLDFQGTRKLHVPQLTEVEGSLLVIECDLPNHEMVGNRYWGIWTGPLFVPKLRSVEGSFEIGMAESVIVPALAWVCFDIVLTYFTTTFVANRLLEVGGSLHAESATILFR